jgi:hypothetical protein
LLLWACGTRAVATSAQNSDELSDISRPLLLPPTVAMGDMTLDDHCYYWARDMSMVASGATAVIGRMASDDRCYCGARGTRAVSASLHSSDEVFGISGMLLLPS